MQLSQFFTGKSETGQQAYRVPIKKPMIGISWVRGKFHAVYFKNGVCISRTESSESVDTLAEFKLVLSKAVVDLKADAKCDVCIVYEGESIQHPFLQAPPMGRKDLKAFLKRRVPDENPFNEEPAWSWTHTFAAKGGEGILFHFMPKSFRNELIAIIQEIGLFPKLLFPFSTVISQHAHRLKIKKQDIVALIATFTDHTDILVIRGDGEILFLRDLGYAWRNSKELLIRDIDRSILYAKQQFSIAVTHLSFAGEDSEELQNSLKEHVSLAVSSPSEDDHHAFCWAMDACRLSDKYSSNLIPGSIRRQRLKNTMHKWSIIVTMLLMLCATVVALQVEFMVASSEKVQKQRSIIDQLMLEKSKWEMTQIRFKEKQEKLHLLAGNDFGNNSLLFLGYLDEIVPSNYTLTRATTRLDNGAIHFSLQGVAGNRSDANIVIDVLAKMDQKLSAPPLLATVNKDWQGLNGQLMMPGDSEQKASQTFAIEGTIR